MKTFFGYLASALIISVITLFFFNRPSDKEKLVSNLQSYVFDIFSGEIDTDTQLMYLESISRALNTGSCTSEDIGIISEGKWVSHLRTLVNYRRALENRNYLTTQAVLGKNKDDPKKLEAAVDFIERFNDNLWRHGYDRVLLTYEIFGESQVAMSPEEVILVEVPQKFWVKK